MVDFAKNRKMGITVPAVARPRSPEIREPIPGTNAIAFALLRKAGGALTSVAITPQSAKSQTISDSVRAVVDAVAANRTQRSQFFHYSRTHELERAACHDPDHSGSKPIKGALYPGQVTEV